MTGYNAKQERERKQALTNLFLSDKAAPEIASLTAAQIQFRINELNFAIGYIYQLLSFPPPQKVEEAKFDTIYVESTEYKRVYRLESSEDLDAAREPGTFYIYVDPANPGVIHAAWQESEETKLKQINVDQTDNITKLLPYVHNFSYNAVLLRKLNAACAPAVSTGDNIALCTVRYYDDTYKTIVITQKDLKVAQISSDSIERKGLMILNMLEKKGYINRGLNQFNQDEQILPDSYKKEERAGKERNLKAALALEVVYWYLAWYSSYIGYLQLTGSPSASMIISIIGATDDFFNNIWGVLTDNDGTGLAFLTLPDLSTPLMKNIAPWINVANNFSFLVGGSGNSIGLLALLPILYTTSPIAFYIVAAALVVPISILGKDYYQGFNMKRYLGSLGAVEKYLLAPKADHDKAYERDIAIGLAALKVIGFRSFGFGGIAIVLLTVLMITNGWVSFTFGIIATLATAISILVTRIKSIVDEWSNNHYAYLSDDEKLQAWEKLTYKDLFNTLCSLATFDVFLTAVGLVLLTNLENKATMGIFSGIGAFLIFVICRAQILREIDRCALGKLIEDGIHMEDRIDAYKKEKFHQPIEVPTDADDVFTPLIATSDKGATDSLNDMEMASPIHVLSADERIEKKMAAAELYCKIMQKPYLEFSVKDFWKKPLSSIPVVMGTIVAISVANRGVSFLGYVDILNKMLDVVITIDVSYLQILGIAAVLIVANVLNMFLMFYENATGNVSRKIVDAKTEYYETADGSTTFSEWRRENWWSSLFRTSSVAPNDTLRRTPGACIKAAQAEIEELQSQLPMAGGGRR
ncbi:MAG: hypothetical protein KBD83_05565 [Gammaproteobacteria bacterium]|nr:hypothetical protein [Gammaproteobacteria bacterium]